MDGRTVPIVIVFAGAVTGHHNRFGFQQGRGIQQSRGFPFIRAIRYDPVVPGVDGRPGKGAFLVFVLGFLGLGLTFDPDIAAVLDRIPGGRRARNVRGDRRVVYQRIAVIEQFNTPGFDLFRDGRTV